MNYKQQVHNYLTELTGGNYPYQDLKSIVGAFEYAEKNKKKKKFKVALLFICVNEPYHQYIKDAVGGASEFFLPGHNVDKFLWSDVPKEQVKDLGLKELFEIEPVEWPLPTLYRYHLFLQQEEKLKGYDYVFYCDIDMRFVNVVGDEILSPARGISAAQHPMYAISEADNQHLSFLNQKNLNPPFEPNPESAAYVPYPKFYYAGGFQGGGRKAFIKMCKALRKNIDKDFTKNYMARWNDESHYNRYLIDTQPDIVLSPSFVYPDSLVRNADGTPGYYMKIWGRDYPAKIITITKPFTVSSVAAEELNKQMKDI